MSSFRPRRATRADAPAVAGLVAALERALLGSSEYGEGDLLAEWRELDVEHDAWIVEDGAEVVGYCTATLRGAVGMTDGYVHPDRRGRGVGTLLVNRLEDEVRRRGGRRVQTATLLADTAAHALLRGRGYDEVRRFWQMRIELTAPPAAASWPEGITGERLDPADVEAFHAALEDAFADHWNHEPTSLERFRRAYVDVPDFAPSLWTVARAGDEVAGGTVCEPQYDGVGWIARVFTRRPWRGRGLGSALVADACAGFWERGQRSVGLGVDAQSDTGAQRLYERAGMHVHRVAVVFGRDLA